MRLPTFALTVLLASCGPRRPVPIQQDLFPLIEGATWTYQAAFNGGSVVEEKVCVREDTADGMAWVFLDAADTDKETATVYSNMFGLGVYRSTAHGIETADAFWREEVNDVSASDFQPMLTLPPGPGTTVEWQTGHVDRSSITVVGWESVTVPAGTFEPALHLDLGGKGHAWLAPGVGLVRWELVTGRIEELQSWRIPAD